MAKTLIDAINEILKRVGSLNSDGGELVTLVVSARQRSIDVAVQVVNEGMDELYLTSDAPQPTQQVTATLVLVQGTRSYDLPATLVRLRFPMIDRTNNQTIYEYPGGFNKILMGDPEQDDAGLPRYAAISPEDGKLYLDRIPGSDDNAKTYHYQYDKDLALAVVGDQFPFNNLVFRAMVPVWVQLWRRDMQNEFDNDLYKLNLGRASRALTRSVPRTSYCPR